MNREIWFTADTHYGHKNIVLGTSNWEDKTMCRKFDTLDEHNKAIVKGINDNVKKDDILYIIGDFAMGGRQNIYKFRKQIICENIHIIVGNHDHFIHRNSILIDDSGQEIFAQDLFSSVNTEGFKFGKTYKFVMYHYALRTWRNSNLGSYHLYGHSHGELEKTPYGRSMDVGVDCAYNLYGQYRPFHMKEIINILETRKIQNER